MIGFLTLLKREVMRFIKDALDTIAPPTVDVILYMLIFGLALGARLGEVQGVSYIQFMMPGLILMSIIRNSFYNPAYSLFQSRWDGNIADALSSPLSYTQMALAIILGGVARGLLVGVLVLIAALVLTNLPFAHPILVLVYGLSVSIAFAGLGCIVGLCAKNWEGINTVNVFLLDPLVLLGGVFYSLEMVRGIAVIESLTRLNPFTYIIGGFRGALLGTTEADAIIGLILALGLGVVLVMLSILLFRVGYHLKA
ncbi:ABC transporter permease [Candidatus Acetothermia bacterium]|nr:ABC transporter permease [Candidatus Acetothermia bacterium]MBI3661408.1 ABC transporter permease [Candidatus Acetothermia bacterium]